MHPSAGRARRALLFVLAASLGIASVAARAADRLAEADANRLEAAQLHRAGAFAPAERLARDALAARTAMLGEAHPDVAVSLNDLASVLRSQHRHALAATLYRRAVTIGESLIDARPLLLADSLSGLGRVLGASGDYPAAEREFRRALALREQALGPHHPAVAEALSGLAGVLATVGRYAEAEAHYHRAIAVQEQALGAEHPDLAESLDGLGRLLIFKGNLPEAEPPLLRGLAIRERALGVDHPEVANSLDNLIELWLARARNLSEISGLISRSRAIRDNAFGRDHPTSAKDLGQSGSRSLLEGRLLDAEQMYEDALDIAAPHLRSDHPDIVTMRLGLVPTLLEHGFLEKAERLVRQAMVDTEAVLGPGHVNMAACLIGLAGIAAERGDLDEAGSLFRRGFGVYEAAVGFEHPFIGIMLNGLARLTFAQGRADEADRLYARGLDMLLKLQGKGSLDVTGTVAGIGTMLEDAGAFEKAEQYYRYALAVREAELGADSDASIDSLDRLANLYLKQDDRLDEAERLFRRVLNFYQEQFSNWKGHPQLYRAHANLGAAMLAQRKYDAAEPHYTEAIRAALERHGPEHRAVAEALSAAAGFYQATNRSAEAIDAARRAARIVAARLTRPEAPRPDTQASERRRSRGYFLHVLGLLGDRAKEAGGSSPDLVEEAFYFAQLAGSVETASAISGMAARFAAGSDALARLVRNRQDLLQRWAHLERSLAKAASLKANERDQGVEAEVQREVADLDRALKVLDARILAEFPRYAEIADPRPVGLAEAQALLGAEEALVAWSVAAERSFVFALRRDRAVFAPVELPAAELREAVATLRAGLEPPDAMAGLADIPSFDAGAAHDLYRKLFSAAEPLLADARHVLVVPDGALQSLPLGVLVTQAPQAPVRDFGGYAEVPWLARRFATTVLPAVSSLRALRLFSAQARASRPFAGFGDPLFQGAPDSTRKVRLAGLFRGGTADIAQVRELARLPGTAEELQAHARALGAPEAAIRLQARATEAEVKRADLSDVRVLSFATHGLVAGDLRGLAEPALALTPPDIGTAEDDALLTASEVAQLKLNADWVVLSACNTAAPDGAEGAEGLSGLAKAFFYAGARSLLVSHWPVETNAAVLLTTRAFAFLEQAPGLGRAEALRRSMLAMVDGAKITPQAAHLAHPMFWAPFVLVGEGAAGR